MKFKINEVKVATPLKNVDKQINQLRESNHYLDTYLT